MRVTDRGGRGRTRIKEREKRERERERGVYLGRNRKHFGFVVPLFLHSVPTKKCNKGHPGKRRTRSRWTVLNGYLSFCLLRCGHFVLSFSGKAKWGEDVKRRIGRGKERYV